MLESLSYGKDLMDVLRVRACIDGIARMASLWLLRVDLIVMAE